MGSKTNSGRRLKKLWNIEADHVLFHKDGNFYEKLERFPGALCDPDGYVIFSTEEDYLNSPYLNINIKVHVKSSIKDVPRYVRVVH